MVKLPSLSRAMSKLNFALTSDADKGRALYQKQLMDGQRMPDGTRSSMPDKARQKKQKEKAGAAVTEDENERRARAADRAAARKEEKEAKEMRIKAEAASAAYAGEMARAGETGSTVGAIDGAGGRAKKEKKQLTQDEIRALPAEKRVLAQKLGEEVGRELRARQ